MFLSENNTSENVTEKNEKDQQEETLEALFPEEKDRITIEQYLRYKNGELDNAAKEAAIAGFFHLYKEKIYEPLNNKKEKNKKEKKKEEKNEEIKSEVKNDVVENKESENEEVKNEEVKNGTNKKKTMLDWFLENAGIFSYYDSLFNYLRKPDLYSNETNRVAKLYYGALKSIYSQLVITAGSDEKQDPFLSGSIRNKKEIYAHIEKLQNKVIKRCTEGDGGHSLYYQMVKDFRERVEAASGSEVRIVTTNYTNFAEKITGINDQDKISYLHGRLGLFEDIGSKKIGKLDEFQDGARIIPYLLVQSGVKPIINHYQIKEFFKGSEALVDADVLFILGYGLNMDDEHIINILRERLETQKEIHFFIYDEENFKKEVSRVKDLFGEGRKIQFHNTREFKTVLEGLG